MVTKGKRAPEEVEPNADNKRPCVEKPLLLATDEQDWNDLPSRSVKRRMNLKPLAFGKRQTSCSLHFVY